MFLCILQMGDRVGPVGTGETSSSVGTSMGPQRLSPVNWSMVLDRQEALVSTDACHVILTHCLAAAVLFAYILKCTYYLYVFMIECQDAMECTDSGPAGERFLDSIYLRNGAGFGRLQDSANFTASHLQGTQGSFHLSQVEMPICAQEFN